MINRVLLLLVAASALGLMAALVIHAGAFLGHDMQFGMPFWVLHVGVFVVWLPTIAIGICSSLGLSKDPAGFSLSGCPAWMRYVLWGLFLYTLANFFLVLGSLKEGPIPERQSDALTRVFSGHWMFFYYAAFVFLYSARKRRSAVA